MELTSIADGKIMVACTLAELIFISNAINETFEAVEEREFQSKTGEAYESAIEIHAAIGTIIRRAESQ